MKFVEPIRKYNDIKKVKDYLSKNPRNLLLFEFGINTGLRISDILKLKIKDVKNMLLYLKKRLINIKKY